MKAIAIIQCRLNSSRLPAKAALDFCGRPLLQAVIDRCRLATRLDGIVVATSDHVRDDVVADLATQAETPVFRGSLDDVRSRFVGCVEAHGATHFLRVTADNPFVEPRFMDELIDLSLSEPECPYAVHDLSEVVYGTASEMVSVEALHGALNNLPDQGREHVTSGLAGLPGARILQPDQDWADPTLSLTVDTLEQYVAARTLAHVFGSGVTAVPKMIEKYRSGERSEYAFYER